MKTKHVSSNGAICLPFFDYKLADCNMDASPSAGGLTEIDAQVTGKRLFSPRPRDAQPYKGLHDGSAAVPAALTLDKYARDFALFGDWVIPNHPTNAIVPTQPALLGTYIGDLLSEGLSNGRVLSRIAAVQFANEALGNKRWIEDGPIQRQIRDLYRLMPVGRQERAILCQEETTSILKELGPPRTLFDYRQHALLAIGWTSALRRPNIARMRVRDVKIKYDAVYGDRYLEVYVATSKTDQDGKGPYLQITETPGNHPLCAVRAIEAWITRAGTPANRTVHCSVRSRREATRSKLAVSGVETLALPSNEWQRPRAATNPNSPRICYVAVSPDLPTKRVFPAHSLANTAAGIPTR